MSKNKSKRGGVRAGSGRKPVENKLIPVTLYVRESVINQHGGVESLRGYLRGLVTTNV